MKAYEFLVDLRRRGDFANLAAAEVAARAVLGELATRLMVDEADELASQLPEPLGEALFRPHPDTEAVSATVEATDVVQRVAVVLDIGDDAARSQVEAVLTTTAAVVPGGQLHHVLTQLSVDHAALFGRPEPA